MKERNADSPDWEPPREKTQALDSKFTHYKTWEYFYSILLILYFIFLKKFFIFFFLNVHHLNPTNIT